MIEKKLVKNFVKSIRHDIWYTWHSDDDKAIDYVLSKIDTKLDSLQLIAKTFNDNDLVDQIKSVKHSYYNDKHDDLAKNLKHLTVKASKH